MNMIGRFGGVMGLERDVAGIVKDLVDSDPERGIVLLSADRRAVYSNAAARSHLRDGTPRGRDGLLPAAIDRIVEAFLQRMQSQRGPLSREVFYPSDLERRLRIAVEAIYPEQVAHVVLRVSSVAPWTEPTVRGLQARFGLTTREAQVASVVVRGLSNAEAAKQLEISEKTVKNVLMAVFDKCVVRNRVELALRAYDAPVPGPEGGARA
jgi:DNA-binding NarL/FixJ family response regulator